MIREFDKKLEISGPSAFARMAAKQFTEFLRSVHADYDASVFEYLNGEVLCTIRWNEAR